MSSWENHRKFKEEVPFEMHLEWYGEDGRRVKQKFKGDCEGGTLHPFSLVISSNPLSLKTADNSQIYTPTPDLSTKTQAHVPTTQVTCLRGCLLEA